jgi:TRAP-type C4-dicarboxylate transport system permease small subunit
MYDAIGRVVKVIHAIEGYLVTYMLLAIVLSMSLQVVMRYLFGNPLTWSEELCILLLIYLSYISADMVYRNKGHIAITYFIDLFPPNWKWVLQCGVHSLVILGLFLIFLKSLQVIKMQAHHTIAAALPLPKSFWVFPIALVFPSMILTAFHFILQELSGKKLEQEI